MKLVVVDMMDFWICEFIDFFYELFKWVDGLVLNDSEVKLLINEENFVMVVKCVFDFGLSFVVVKKGEYGVMYCLVVGMFLFLVFFIL